MMGCSWRVRTRTCFLKNLAAYDAGACVGFFPIAFARDRDHAEEVFNKIVDERDGPVGEPDVDIEERWLH